MIDDDAFTIDLDTYLNWLVGGYEYLGAKSCLDYITSSEYYQSEDFELVDYTNEISHLRQQCEMLSSQYSIVDLDNKELQILFEASEYREDYEYHKANDITYVYSEVGDIIRSRIDLIYGSFINSLRSSLSNSKITNHLLNKELNIYRDKEFQFINRISNLEFIYNLTHEDILTLFCFEFCQIKYVQTLHKCLISTNPINELDDNATIQKPIKPIKWTGKATTLGTIFGLLIDSGLIDTDKKNVANFISMFFINSNDKPMSINTQKQAIEMRINSSSGKSGYDKKLVSIIEDGSTVIELIEYLKSTIKD